MGNCEACFSRKAVEEQPEGSSEGEEMVRVVRTTDNELFEFPGPVSVKDLLFGFQGFAVYPQCKPPSSSSHFKSRKPAAHRPLHPNTLLKLSHLYYLQPLVNPSLIINPDDTKSLLAKHSSKWAKPALIKPFINVGDYSLINTSDKDLLLGQQVDMSSAGSSINGVSGDLLAWKPQEMLERDLNVQEKEGPTTFNAQEGSFKEHATEALNTIDAQPAHAPPEASLALNAHDRTSNDLAEGGFTSSNARETPSSFDQLCNDQSISSQTIKRRKVRFSDEVEVIPSSSFEFIDSASTSPTCSPRIVSPVEEAIHRCGEGSGQFDKQAGWCSASKEKGIPQHMSKTELINGVVRLKVVISKKQLAELMAARASGGKENNALMMEKMLAPLLPPTAGSCHKSKDSFHGGSCASPSWRPSLHHIPENDHSLHELF